MKQDNLKDAHKMLDEWVETLMADLTPWRRFWLRVQFKIDDIKVWVLNKYYDYVEWRNNK